VQGGEIFTIDAGEGPPVVFVHGSPVSSAEFRASIGRLAPSFRVLAPDLLTFGRSSGPQEGADFHDQARALRELLDQVDLGRFHLIAHDWGGPIGLAAAARRPDRLDRLALLNTSIRPDFNPPPYWRLLIGRGAGEAALVGANVFSHGLPLMLRAARRDQQLRALYREPLERTSTRRTVLKLERLEGYAEECELVQTALPEIRGRKMILWGDPDPYFRGESARLRAMLPTAHFVPLPGAGHFPTEDAPDRVADEIYRFLTAS
jgi:haloalkane dehalogenase